MWYDASEITISGNVGIPEGGLKLRYTNTNNVPVVNLRVARHIGQSGQQGQQQTEWWSIVVFGDLALNCIRSLKQGDRVHVTGRIQMNHWVSQQTQIPQTTPEIVADDVALSVRWNPVLSQRQPRATQAQPQAPQQTAQQPQQQFTPQAPPVPALPPQDQPVPQNVGQPQAPQMANAGGIPELPEMPPL